MTQIFIGDVARAVKNGVADDGVDEVIAQFIIDQQRDETVLELRHKYYKQLREWALPDAGSMVLSLIKARSGNAAIAADGNAELNIFEDTYIAVLNRFKPS